MDDQDAGSQPDDKPLESRPPTMADFVSLCRELNLRGAKYIVIGGFAIIANGLARLTQDIDLLVASDLDNESKVFSALAMLPDKAVNELAAGELEKHKVVRVADEVLVDLLVCPAGIRYEEAKQDIFWDEVDGVKIPFASPVLLYRLKARTHREKDSGDIFFLRNWFAERGLQPPRV